MQRPPILLRVELWFINRINELNAKTEQKEIHFKQQLQWRIQFYRKEVSGLNEAREIFKSHAHFH